jgi:hypothetical protein
MQSSNPYVGCQGVAGACGGWYKGFFLPTLRRLGIIPSHLHHHRVKILVHINPKLDVRFARIKLQAGSLV